MNRPDSDILESTHELVRSLSGLLIARKCMLATAESCTGGLIASVCTEYPGSSLWFWGGFVTYANHAKNVLGVPASLIEQYGAVSEQVAAAMASSAAKRSGVDLTLAVSGIAGPDGGTEDKPVGTLCFGWHIRGRDLVQTRKYSGNRQQIRLSATKYALHNAVQLLQKS